MLFITFSKFKWCSIIWLCIWCRYNHFWRNRIFRIYQKTIYILGKK